jgi:hypothetical protein
LKIKALSIDDCPTVNISPLCAQHSSDFPDSITPDEWIQILIEDGITLRNTRIRRNVSILNSFQKMFPKEKFYVIVNGKQLHKKKTSTSLIIIKPLESLEI